MERTKRHDIAGGDVEIRTRLEQLRLRQRAFEKHLASHLTVDPAGLAVMDYLMSAHSATPTELAGRLDISTAAMTLVLDRLAAAGHVTREPHPSDRRKVLVTAAPESVQDAFGQVQPLIDGVENLVDGLSETERAVVSTFLTDVVRIYEASTPTPQ